MSVALLVLAQAALAAAAAAAATPSVPKTGNVTDTATEEIGDVHPALRGGRVESLVGIVEAELVHVSTPAEFNKALRAVVTSETCSAKGAYKVASGLFGTATSYDVATAATIADLAGNPEKPLAWLTGAEGLAAFLNSASDGCCGVGSLSKCLCRIAEAVGIIDTASGVSYLNPVPPSQYVYAVVNAALTNTTSNIFQSEVNAIVPTWENLLDVMGQSFRYTLGANSDVAECSPTPEVRSILSGSSYQTLFAEYSSRFAELGASLENCKLQADVLLEKASSVCTDPVVARLYLCTFFDANPLFMGTGLTSGGQREFITMPNPSIVALEGTAADVDVLSFDLPQTGDFSCDADAADVNV